MSAPQKIKDLVEKFKMNEHIYKDASSFDEENTKIEFINPFFEALGWDIRNENNLSPLYKDVEFENSIKIDNKTKAPDYAFRIGGQTKFFVEAKKPSVEIETDRKSAFQVRRYGWSAKLDLCILTDFETLAVYETNTRPDKSHNASIGRLKLYHYSEYIDKWDEISNIFSKDAILKGNFDNYVSGHDGIKKGTSEVDDEFLKEIEKWRDKLARNIALRNKELTIEELNYAVQLIIDRIIFLRIAEDRGIERYETLLKLLDEQDIYKNFCKLCKKADIKYNSGLFHFTEEKEISLSADTLTPTLIIDDKIFKEIFKELYYPNSPYEFSLISPEILGSIYERFLGKTIYLTDSHMAKIKPKDNTQKKRGVYYTPEYIVNFMVEQTVGNLLKNKTPNQVEKIKILDPACGSGSFLLGVYQYLIDWHIKYYSNLKKPPKNAMYVGKDNIPRLTIHKKKEILLNNIFGVDLDSQAVEVTKLSLLLKVLEDQNKDLVEAQQKLFQERALPYLGDNIKCGNSLLDSSMLQDDNYDIDKIISLNPFDWENEFKDIICEGGFDLIIGNPPYIKESTNKNAFNGLRKSEYYQGKMDLWYMFGCKALDLVKENGLISFIATNNWITNSGASIFRNKVNDDAKFKLFIDFGNYKVFDHASIQTMIYIMEKNNTTNNYHFKFMKLLDNKINDSLVKRFLYEKENPPRNTVFETAYNRVENKDSYLNFIDKHNLNILNKIIKTENITFFESREVSTGIDVHQDFLNKEGSKLLKLPIGSGIFVINDKEKENMNLTNKELELIKPYYTTNEIHKYFIEKQNKLWVIYTKSNINKDINLYPNIKKHLNKFSKVITSDNKPYGLHRARNEDLFKNEKIIVTRKCLSPTFSYADFDTYVSQTFMVIKTDRFDLKYLTGVLNSSLIQFWLKFKGKMQGNNYQLDKAPLLKIPIIIPNKDDELNMVDLVDKICELKEKLNDTNISNEQRIINDQININKNKVDSLVYQLYDLTPEEIQIIEKEIKI